MNAVEIEQAISDLADAPFNQAEFPYAFLEAFGNKATTLQRLRTGATNKSDLGGVLQTGNIHIATCAAGEVPKALQALRASARASPSIRRPMSPAGCSSSARCTVAVHRAIPACQRCSR